MSNGIPLPKIKTTARQDIRMLCAILNVCKSGSIPAPGVQLHLKGCSDILDGKPIDFDSLSFEEKVRVRSFSGFAISVFAFLLDTKFCKIERRLLETPMRAPMEVEYVKVTRAGRIFAGSPFMVQWILVKTIGVLFFSVSAVKKYRWIFSVASISTAALAWAKAHDITGTLVVLAIISGISAAIFVAWVAYILGFDGDDT